MATESLNDALSKRRSFAHMWALLNVKPQYRGLYDLCMREWNKLSYRQQQQKYWYIREKLRKGEVVHDNPLYALTYIIPRPTNWNGKQGIDDMLRTTPMVTAFYNGSFGTYTRLEATIFEMTHIEPYVLPGENA